MSKLIRFINQSIKHFFIIDGENLGDGCNEFKNRLPDSFTNGEGLPKDVPDLTACILLDRIVKNADRSLLRSDIDAEKAQKIILWTMDGFMNSLLACGGDIENYKSHYDQCMKEFEGYLQLLRKLLYQ